MKKKISMTDIFKNPRYRGKHIILAAGKIYTAKTGDGAADILKKIRQKTPVSYQRILPPQSPLPDIMAVKFAFEKVGRSFFGIVYRPVAEVSFQSPTLKTWLNTWMVVDTGADFTILPRYLSADLNISLERDCIKDTTYGVGGQQILFLCKSKIKAKIKDIEREIPIAFLDNSEVPALMGRLGFLETFDTQFLKTHQIIFKD